MKPSRLPSIGFLIICLTYGMTVSLLAWGFSTPRLDRVWQLHHQMKSGSVWNLDRTEKKLLQQAIRDHEQLASALIHDTALGILSAHRDGWVSTPEVTMLRTPQAPVGQTLLLDIRTPAQYVPFKITISGDGWKKKLQVTQREQIRMELPPPPKAAEVITLKIKGKALRNDPTSLGLRVTFASQEAPTP